MWKLKEWTEEQQNRKKGNKATNKQSKNSVRQNYKGRAMEYKIIFMNVKSEEYDKQAWKDICFTVSKFKQLINYKAISIQYPFITEMN